MQYINVCMYVCMYNTMIQFVSFFIKKITDSKTRTKIRAHINWQWTTLDVPYHFGKQTSDPKMKCTWLCTIHRIQLITTFHIYTYARSRTQNNNAKNKIKKRAVMCSARVEKYFTTKRKQLQLYKCQRWKISSVLFLSPIFHATNEKFVCVCVVLCCVYLFGWLLYFSVAF